MNVSLNSVTGVPAAPLRCRANQRANVWRFHAGSDRLLIHTGQRPQRQPVRKRREAAAPLRQPIDVAEQPRAQRRAVPLPVIRQEFALEAGHVHADRAFRFAGAALQAEVEHIEDALVAEPRFAQFPGHRQAQRIGAPARRVRLIAGRPCRKGTSCRPVSCGRRRRRCTSRPRRPCRRTRRSRTTSPASASGIPRRGAGCR